MNIYKPQPGRSYVRLIPPVNDVHLEDRKVNRSVITGMVGKVLYARFNKIIVWYGRHSVIMLRMDPKHSDRFSLPDILSEVRVRKRVQKRRKRRRLHKRTVRDTNYILTDARKKRSKFGKVWGVEMMPTPDEQDRMLLEMGISPYEDYKDPDVYEIKVNVDGTNTTDLTCETRRTSAVLLS